MKINNWLNLDHHEYVAIDLADGRRIELKKGDKLLISVESVYVTLKDGVSHIYPAIQVTQIIKRLKRRYL